MSGALDLSGHSVLVVEDDYYIAIDTAAALKGAGAQVLGPCPREEDTRRLLEHQTPTAASGRSQPRRRRAAIRDRPAVEGEGRALVFLTGYDPDVIPSELADVERLQKPIPLRHVVEAVARL